jgi:hypothetical protein
MSMPEKKDFSFDKPETDKVEETVAPVEEAPAEDAPEAEVATVKIDLAEDYDGPTPVYVSTVGHDRIELPAEVPATDALSFTNLPYVEVIE